MPKQSEDTYIHIGLSFEYAPYTIKSHSAFGMLMNWICHSVRFSPIDFAIILKDINTCTHTYRTAHSHTHTHTQTVHILMHRHPLKIIVSLLILMKYKYKHLHAIGICLFKFNYINLHWILTQWLSWATPQFSCSILLSCYNDMVVWEMERKCACLF